MGELKVRGAGLWQELKWGTPTFGCGGRGSLIGQFW